MKRMAKHASPLIEVHKHMFYRQIMRNGIDAEPNDDLDIIVLNFFCEYTQGTNTFVPPGNPVYEMPDSGLGEIYLFRALDYEALYDDGQTQFLLEIHARDNNVDAALRKTSTQTLTINVEDSDDLSPTFYYPNCRQVQGLANSCVVAAYSASITSGN
ncbi:CAD99-like protein, partial [Mya arenaria]